jgi:hypothetical protein
MCKRNDFLNRKLSTKTMASHLGHLSTFTLLYISQSIIQFHLKLCQLDCLIQNNGTDIGRVAEIKRRIELNKRLMIHSVHFDNECRKKLCLLGPKEIFEIINSPLNKKDVEKWSRTNVFFSCNLSVSSF